MKVLFVHTDIAIRGGARSFPLGLAALSAVLRRGGHETAGHAVRELCGLPALRRRVAEFRPDILAFSAVSPQFRHVRRLLAGLGRQPCFTVLGGPHATLSPGCLEDVPELDALCVGEGELPLADLAAALTEGRAPDRIAGLWLRKPDGTIVRNPPRPFLAGLDPLPFPDRGLFDHQAVVDSDFGTAHFMFSRGCPHGCAFCSNPALRTSQPGAYVRSRSVENCLQEIAEVAGRYRVRALVFDDDCFTARPDFVADFCAGYRSRFALPFEVNSRPEDLSEDLCRRLKEAGCRRVSIGVESGSEAFRRSVLRRNHSDEDIVRAFALCRQAGLKTKSFNIVGFPGETPELFRQTVALNARIQPDGVSLSVYEPYAGTPLAEECRAAGWLDPGREAADFVGRTDTALDMPLFPREEVLRCFRSFACEVYRGRSPAKAAVLRVYYSRWGERLLRLLSPVKGVLRRMVMGV